MTQDAVISTIAAQKPNGFLLSGGGNTLPGDGRPALSLQPL
ncbi:hypothetical protein [Pseudorhodobacter sp.]|nr:hypothetical protein [Pseudorhodobacter sp.]